MKEIIKMIEGLRARLNELDNGREKAILLTELEKYEALVRYYNLGGKLYENGNTLSKSSAK